MTQDEMIWVGKHCSVDTCRQTDFLPNNCTYCHRDYCTEHAAPSLKYSDDDHFCEPYKAAEVARSGRSKNTYNELSTCGSESCNAKLVSPIRCTECSHNFCTYHYHPNTHKCKDVSRLANQGRSAASNKAGLQALKRLGQSNSSSGRKPQQQQPPPPQSDTKTRPNQSKSVLSNIIPNMERIQAGASTHSPITSFRSDRRSKSERDSQLRALQEREKKGILSSNDKVRLAEFRALQSQSGKGKECKVQ